MKILSIQSHVAYGHAGNSAAVFPLQRLGHEVYPVLTVNFSNHTGYGSSRGPLIAPTEIAEVIQGIFRTSGCRRLIYLMLTARGIPIGIETTPLEPDPVETGGGSAAILIRSRRPDATEGPFTETSRVP